MFPDPAQDVPCAASFAVARARDAGLTPGPLVLIGHSAGAHLAALAATADPAWTTECPDPVVPVDGLVGLAGVYDTRSFEFALVDFFGATYAEDPGVWAAGDPIERVAGGLAPAGLHVLLRHGDADQTVPLAQSQAFATALETASVPVQLDVLPGIAHAGVYSVDVSAGPTIAWITSTWPTGATAAPQGPRSLGSRPPPEDRSPR